MNKLVASIKLFESGNLKGLAGSGDFENPTNAGDLFNRVLSGTIGILTIIAFVWFVFLVISGALGIMFSSGDKNAVATGAKKISNGLIGIVIIILAIALIRAISFLLGVDTIFLDPGKFIEDFKL